MNLGQKTRTSYGAQQATNAVCTENLFGPLRESELACSTAASSQAAGSRRSQPANAISPIDCHRAQHLGVVAPSSLVGDIDADVAKISNVHFRLADGVAVEHWGVMDTGTLMQQLTGD